MATEEGIVIHTHDKLARVKTSKTASCKACTARDSCHGTEAGKIMEVDAINGAGAREGDRILLHFDTASLMKACFLLYLLPVGFMLMGAIFGHWLALKTGMNVSLISALSGFLSLFLAFVMIRSKANTLGKNDAYKPKIVKILNHAPIS
ncbi:MAG: SoxR reducing system RseC family protein [Desulfobacterales bacterium]|nr:SoxR reducing system RseC family protein [Desulfobacterales bacterium]MDX2511888.1 SoxR reducing system RseC family protein [Desulfobacterales bacterium]